MSNFNGVASVSTTNIVPVQAQFDSSGNCLGLIGPGGVFFSPPLTSDTITGATIDNSTIGATTPSTVNATNVSINGKLHVSATAPTIASGFGTSPTITAFNSSAFKIVVGTGGAANGVITFPAAPNGWVVYAQDVTSGTSLFLQQTASTTTSATLTSFSITLGIAANMTAGDTIIVMAFPY